MPGGTTVQTGNVKLQTMLGWAANTFAYPAVGANTTAIQTYSVPGLLPNDLVDVQLQGHQAGLSVSSAWCAAAGTLTVQWVNSTATPVTASNFPASIVLIVSRFEDANIGPPGSPPWLQAIV